MEPQKRIGEYVFIEKIGKGGQATVWKGLNGQGESVAIKKMSVGSNSENQRSYEREVAILKLVQHEYLVKNLACFRESNHYYLVYEYCPCDLLQFLQKQPTKSFPEHAVKRWIKQLISVMIKLNSFNIIHRDLKPDNILLTNESLDADIRLADFGLAKQGLTTLSFVGTLEYASPEIKNCQKYSFNTDVWSLGVIVFAALSGKLPVFQGNKVIFPNCHISDQAKSFIEECLVYDYIQRPQFQNLLFHEFLADKVVSEMIVEEFPILPKKNRSKDELIYYTYQKITLCDDILRFVEGLGENMKFLCFFISKYFTEKFEKLINLILQTGLDTAESEFLEHFFTQTEKSCIVYNDLGQIFKNLSDDDLGAYNFQIGELINQYRDQIQSEYLKILQKIAENISSKIENKEIY